LSLALVASVFALTACGSSAPPARELAEEMIDTLVVSDPVKDCMKAEVEGFALTETEAQGFEDLDDVADKAAGGQEQAIQIMSRFQSVLAGCNAAG